MAERHIAHSCALALRQLYRSHLALVANVMRRRILSRQRGAARSSSSNRGNEKFRGRPRLDSWSAGSTAEVQPHRALEVDDVSTAKNIALIETYFSQWWSSMSGTWKPAQALLNNTGLGALLRVVAATNRYGSRNQYLLESARYCLDVLSIESFLPSVCKALCDVEVTIDRKTSGMNILLVACSGEVHNDPKIIILALQVLCHMVTPRLMNKELVSKKETGNKHQEQQEKVQRRLRVKARANDAISVGLELLDYKSGSKSADAIRHLASRFLFGLAHDQDVAQILTKLQVTKKMESICQSGPVVQINKRHHKKFAEYTEALSLLISSSSISFKSSVSSTSSSSSSLKLSSTALSSPILKIMQNIKTTSTIAELRQLNSSNDGSNDKTFNNMMKSLVYGYLSSQGLTKTMDIMYQETGLSKSLLEDGVQYHKNSSNRMKIGITKSNIPSHRTNWPAKTNVNVLLNRKRWRRPKKK